MWRGEVGSRGTREWCLNNAGAVFPRFVVTGRYPNVYDQQSCKELVKDYVQQEADRSLALTPLQRSAAPKAHGRKSIAGASMS